MHRGIAFQFGRATKRSYFGNEIGKQLLKTREVTESCVRSDFDFHFVDAEWQRNYMPATELDSLLSWLEELGSNLTTVVTINARHQTAFDLSAEYAECMRQHDNGGLCFVAGSSTYLSEEERELDGESRIIELVKTSRSKLPSAPIFLGSEGMHPLSLQVAASHNVIPFMLLGKKTLNTLAERNSIYGVSESAVYCPAYLSPHDEKKLVKAFGPYALRRRWVRRLLREHGLNVVDVKSQISNGGLTERTTENLLANAIRELALCKRDHAEQTLRCLSSLGVRYAAVLQAEQSAEEFENLRKLASQFNS